MNNITTTTIRDTVSISENGSLQVEEFDVNFNSSSKTMDYDKYVVRNVENYPSILMFIKNTLSNFASTEILEDELLFKIRDYMKK